MIKPYGFLAPKILKGINMNLKNSRPCGDFRTSYNRDMTMFDDKKGFYLNV